MTEPATLFDAIESQEFATLVNVASQLKTFLRGVDNHPAVRELTAACAAPQMRDHIRQRFVSLVAMNADEGLEHPNDAAVAAYLRVLERTDVDLARRLAGSIPGGRQWWWATKVAARLQAPVNGSLDGDGKRSVLGESAYSG